MTTFVDTSGLFAVLNVADQHHAIARTRWRSLVLGGECLTCTSYVLLETFALIQSRLGIPVVRRLDTDLYPLLTVEWVTPEVHEAAVAALLAADRRQLSLVDCVSFEVMRRLGIRRAFAFDPHFGEQGFEVVPGPPPVTP